MKQVKILHETEKYNKAIKSSEQKFEAAKELLSYIFEIAPEGETFNLTEALTNPTQYIRKYFVEVYNSSIPAFVEPDKAIDLSLYSESKLVALTKKYNEIQGRHPIDTKGKLKQIEPKFEDYDCYLNPDKVKEYELVNTICNAANELVDLGTRYFIINHVAISLGYNVMTKQNGNLHNHIEPRPEMWI